MLFALALVLSATPPPAVTAVVKGERHVFTAGRLLHDDRGALWLQLSPEAHGCSDDLAIAGYSLLVRFLDWQAKAPGLVVWSTPDECLPRSALPGSPTARCRAAPSAWPRAPGRRRASTRAGRAAGSR